MSDQTPTDLDALVWHYTHASGDGCTLVPSHLIDSAITEIGNLRERNAMLEENAKRRVDTFTRDFERRESEFVRNEQAAVCMLARVHATSNHLAEMTRHAHDVYMHREAMRTPEIDPAVLEAYRISREEPKP